MTLFKVAGNIYLALLCNKLAYPHRRTHIILHCHHHIEIIAVRHSWRIWKEFLETGYGYIKSLQDNEITSQQDIVQSSELKVQSPIYKVEAFKEKPNLETAKSYLNEGGYYWNAGIFIWNAKMVVNTIANLVPDLASVFDKIEPYFYTDKEQEIINQYFPTCPNISIDYAVMEKADYIYTYPSDFVWSDVGTWGSLWTLLPHDENGNAVIGRNVHLYDCKGCIVHAPEAESVVLEGMEDCIVVEREGRVLICRLSEEQRIKDFEK